jgi:hypothetical protein
MDFWDVNSSKNNKNSRTYTRTRDNWSIREPRQQQEPRSGGKTIRRDNSNDRDANNSRYHI